MCLWDTNVFITAYRFHYGFDFHPGFWEWLVHAREVGRVFSIKKVYEEICRQEDDLFTWVDSLDAGFFLGNRSDSETHLERVSDYVKSKNFRLSDIQKFLESADYYLIAHALSNNFKVVTHEVYKSSKGKIKIPFVCKNLNIECITPFDMLRQERARFIWQSSR